MDNFTNNSNNQTPFCNLSCEEQLKQVYNAYADLLMGKSVVEVEYENRRVKYSSKNISALKELFQMLYNKCGQSSDIPDISNPNTAIKRHGINVRFCP